MPMLMATSTLTYSTTTGRPTATQKHATAVAAIDQMHLAANFLTTGELRDLLASQAEWKAWHCSKDNQWGEACDGHLNDDGSCPNEFYHWSQLASDLGQYDHLNDASELQRASLTLN